MEISSNAICHFLHLELKIKLELILWLENLKHHVENERQNEKENVFKFIHIKVEYYDSLLFWLVI